MDITLWRGSTLLGRGDLQEGKRPGLLQGPIYRTPALDQLGPIAQHRFPGVPFLQNALPRASEWAQHSSKQGEIVISESDPASHARHDLSPDQLLTVRSANGEEIAMDLISIMEPPEFPEEFTKLLNAGALEQLRLWRVTCQVATGDTNAA